MKMWMICTAGTTMSSKLCCCCFFSLSNSCILLLMVKDKEMEMETKLKWKIKRRRKKEENVKKRRNDGGRFKPRVCKKVSKLQVETWKKVLIKGKCVYIAASLKCSRIRMLFDVCSCVILFNVLAFSVIYGCTIFNIFMSTMYHVWKIYLFNC